MLEFAKAQSETVAIVADAVDRFQRSFKESVLIDDLFRREQVELHFYRRTWSSEGRVGDRHHALGLLGDGREIVRAQSV